MRSHMHGRRIATQYIEFWKEGDPLMFYQKMKELVQKEKDPRMTEILLRLHKIYMERVDHNAG